MTRPFDLKAALSGEPVQYRDFPPAVFERVAEQDEKVMLRFCNPTLGLYDGWILSDLDGKVLKVRDGGETQLTMAPRKVKKTVWVSIAVSPFHRPDCAPAISAYAHWDKDSAGVGAVPVEIEVEE